MEMGFTGPNTCIVTACAAGAHGVGEGYRYIVDGLADVCLAGGTEAVITPLSMAGFAQMQPWPQSSADLPPPPERVEPGELPPAPP